MNSNVHSLPAVSYMPLLVCLYIHFIAHHHHHHRRRRRRHPYHHHKVSGSKGQTFATITKFPMFSGSCRLLPDSYSKSKTEANAVQMQIRPLLGRTRLSCPETLRQKQNTVQGRVTYYCTHLQTPATRRRTEVR